nr:hypothetical protein [Tanacetum cinerariifolium]
MLLTSLPSSYNNFVETLLYGKESLTLEDVLSSLNLRELKKRTDAKDDGDGLFVWSDHRDSPNWNKKKSTCFVKKNVGQDSGMHYEGYENGDLLITVSEERFLDWIMDSGGSYHMTLRMEFIFDFKEFNGGTVFLGDNKACAIKGTWKERTIKENYVYSLDGWAELSEASVGIQETESLTQVGPKRMGYISEAGLHELERREVLGNKGLSKLEFYENCVLGKSTRGQFGFTFLDTRMMHPASSRSGSSRERMDAS